jgi:hypothetical protein
MRIQTDASVILASEMSQHGFDQLLFLGGGDGVGHINVSLPDELEIAVMRLGIGVKHQPDGVAGKAERNRAVGQRRS